jgi:peptidoglycan hydrolase-like protein with peptidoglycan-binding domain
MKSIALALVATAALSLPALAQSAPNDNSMNQNPSSSQMQANPSAGQPDNGMKSEISSPISPQSLSKDQIQQIQQALNQNGYDNVKADGVWGPDTADALKQFQQKQNIQANGELDQQTLSALNVQVGPMEQGRAATGTPPSDNSNGSLNRNNGAQSITGNGMKPESGNDSH